MVKLEHGPAVRGPSSALGIMRFFDADTSGPKLSPGFIVGIAIALIIVVLGIKSMTAVPVA
ncbi:MAG: preprotein translocase subunit Sec61beta [Candidatus Diapherotrites archaeon]|nr:preprotein translocase subunit Sec61beta [Candidatus Diapherotrites archaeon]